MCVCAHAHVRQVEERRGSRLAGSAGPRMPGDAWVQSKAFVVVCWSRALELVRRRPDFSPSFTVVSGMTLNG